MKGRTTTDVTHRKWPCEVSTNEQWPLAATQRDKTVGNTATGVDATSRGDVRGIGVTGLVAQQYCGILVYQN